MSLLGADWERRRQKMTRTLGGCKSIAAGRALPRAVLLLGWSARREPMKLEILYCQE
jgi:hypothetical protein